MNDRTVALVKNDEVAGLVADRDKLAARASRRTVNSTGTIAVSAS